MIPQPQTTGIWQQLGCVHRIWILVRFVSNRVQEKWLCVKTYAIATRSWVRLAWLIDTLGLGKEVIEDSEGGNSSSLTNSLEVDNIELIMITEESIKDN